ncbi:hypothetical protein [Methylicorpusculum sp.]|uniref:hypothetical protein n=1 Tax=Methylicorpusculum sp. TaxID=2713644 RepID=UPI00273217A1|nr:hypothetical protein [Methylicorpusculum sp.]MDP2180544.1 hypothetical protein [Methylicorpusculum sp.]MDP3527704.1 hypothetical protein [Methylicorpusculum sp.]MDZ4150704.1 hypothetical protein [Methylicorpusculum sp.]
MNYSKYLIAASVCLLLFGCGENSGNKSQPAVSAAHIEGVVTDRDEPVTQGKILAKDAGGKTVATSDVTNDSKFAITLPASAQYPVVLEVTAGDSVLEAVVLDPMPAQLDISTMSSLVVQSARDIGGITKANMAQAAINAIRQNKKASGKSTSAGFKGDPTKQYGGWH